MEILGTNHNSGDIISPLLGGLMGDLKLFPFMSKGTCRTNDEVNNTKENGIYRLFGSGNINVVPDYSIMIVYNDAAGYIVQIVYTIGFDSVGFRRFYNGEWGDFRTFVLAS